MVTSDHIRCGYVDGAHGQIHYRELGAGTPLVLLHWAPSNGRQYEQLMPQFAMRGFRVLAFDIPGYGNSHKHTAGWSCAQMGEELAIALHRLGGVTRGFLCGGHLSAAVVAEMAIAEPARWPRIVLDGSPTLTREQFGTLMASFADLSPKWTEDGQHERFVWRMTERFLHEWNPDYRATAENFAVHYAYMADYLQMGFTPIRSFIEPGSGKPGGLATYDALARWPLIKSKVLALTAEREVLRVGHDAALARLANHVSHEFSGAHPLLIPARAAEYVDVIANFLQA